MIGFGDENCSDHRLKTSFLFNLWSWSNVHIIEKILFFDRFFVLDGL